MRLGKKWRIGVFVGALAGTVGLVTAASGATGAYFNDSQNGTVTGTVGSIKVSTAGGSGNNGLDFDFANMLPGDFQTSTVHYTNTGANTEDVYLVFDQAAALHSVNDLGTYGEAKIGSNGATVFSSANLNDGEQAKSAADRPDIESLLLVALRTGPAVSERVLAHSRHRQAGH
jgi:hypothetical protein